MDDEFEGILSPDIMKEAVAVSIPDTGVGGEDFFAIEAGIANADIRYIADRAIREFSTFDENADSDDDSGITAVDLKQEDADKVSDKNELAGEALNGSATNKYLGGM